MKLFQKSSPSRKSAKSARSANSRLLWLSTVAVSCAAAFAAPPALAAQPGMGPYVGGNISFGSASSLGGNIDNALANQGLGSATSANHPDTTAGLRLGYGLSPNLGLEASYDRIGSASLQSSISSPAADTASGTWKAHGFGLHVVGTLPIDNQWSVYGRVGAERFHTTLDLSSNSGGATAVSSTSNNTTLAVGAGAAYAITPKLDATAELVHYNRVGADGSTGTSAVNQVNVGLRYHFL